MRLLFYIFILPLSILPFRVLYVLSDLLFLLVYRVFGYRKKVVFDNIKNSFPDKSLVEVEDIAKAFYRHFCDIIIESIALFNITEKEARRRFKPRDMSVMDRLYAGQRSVIIASGHYNNWEMAAVAISSYLDHKVDGVFTPLSNSFMNEKFKASREKFGLTLYPKKQTKEMFESHKGALTATGFGTDQCPSRHAKKAYWMKFLNQDTPVMYGTEKYAKTYDYAVVFMRIHKIKRGFYEFEFELVEEHAPESPYGAITEKHVSLLEQQIMDQPQYWLWTHKRWKLTREEMKKNNE